jgi:uncharacterized protein (DUF1800 family)
MNRREFLKAFVSSNTKEAAASSSLSHWQPNQDNPWDLSAVNHFFHRLGYSATYSEIQAALISSYEEVLNRQLDDRLISERMPDPPNGWEEWLTIPPYAGTDHKILDHEGDLYHNAKIDIRLQWTVLMTQPEIQLREKLTLFWHNHFVVEEVKVLYPQMMFQYFDYLRKNAWGNFKQMVKHITVMPAMLMYLSGIWSSKDSLNENYARELMELFTMGRIGRYGKENYTQQDVRSVALAVTGWRFKFNEPGPNVIPPYFANYYFDFETKTDPFNSEAKVYGLDAAKQYFLFPDSIDKIEADIIDLLFEKRASEIAWFICKKIYRAFVYDDASTRNAEQVIEELAQVLLDNTWELKPVFLALFQSEHFFDLHFRGSAIKSPYEYMCGLMRKLNIPLSDYQAGDFWWFGMDTDQWLCSPPNVKGWPGYHAWLNSATLPKRNTDFAQALIMGREIPGQMVNPHNGFTFDSIQFSDNQLLQWAKEFPDFDGDLTNFAIQISEFLCAITPGDSAIAVLINSSGIVHTYEWASMEHNQKIGPIRNMLFATITLPHFQLC